MNIEKINNTKEKETEEFVAKRKKSNDRAEKFLNYFRRIEEIKAIKDESGQKEALKEFFNDAGNLSDLEKGQFFSPLMSNDFLVERLKEICLEEKENVHLVLDILKVFDHLKKADEFSGDEDSMRETEEALKKIDGDSDNFFLKNKIKLILKKPLSDWATEGKRLLIKLDWKNIVSYPSFQKIIAPALGLKDKEEAKMIDPSDKLMLTDREIELIFDESRKNSPEYFYWQEEGERQNKYEEADLKRYYEIIPAAAERAEEEEKIVQNSCYSRISEKFGVIYEYGGRLDSIFELDRKTENEIEAKKKEFGVIDESSLEFFIAKFKRNTAADKSQFLYYYCQVRRNLPEETKAKIDKKFGFFIPPKLDRSFSGKNEFESESEKFKAESSEWLNADFKRKADYLISELEALLKTRKAAAKEKYFGFASENIDLLDFFNSFNKNRIDRIEPTAHYSICYYFYLRKNLPEELVAEFEERFKLKIPEEIKEFETFDDYLGTSDRELLKPFLESGYEFAEISGWLNKKIGRLSRKIKDQKIKPKRVTIKEILAREGFDESSLPENEYKDLTETYGSLVELPMREAIENKFGIKLKNFSVREQVWFVNFISRKTVSEVDEALEFLDQGKDEKARSERIKSFLALEADRAAGEKILTIARALGERAAPVFSRLAEISVLAQKTEDELKKEVFDKEEKTGVLRLRKNLVRKAHEIIVDFSASLSGKKPIKIEDLLSRLENSRIEIVILGAVLQEGREAGKRIDWDEISRLGMEIKDFGEEMKEEDKKRVLEMAAENWKEEPALTDLVVGEIREMLNDMTKQKCYLLRYRGQVIAFVRFEATDHNTFYAGTLNVDPALRGLGLGEETMNRALIAEGENHILEANVLPKGKVGMCYVEKVGFVIDGYVSDCEQTGEPLFTIRLALEENPRYHYRNEGKEKIKKPSDILSEYVSNDYREGQETIILKFDFSADGDFEKFKKEMEKLLVVKDDRMRPVEPDDENKYRITRYFSNSKEKGDCRYLVLERIYRRSS